MHFLEHMVFMGSEKYPDENSFDKFVTLNGGYDNACTDAETTVFYFECQRKAFKEGERKVLCLCCCNIRVPLQRI